MRFLTCLAVLVAAAAHAEGGPPTAPAEPAADVSPVAAATSTASPEVAGPVSATAPAPAAAQDRISAVQRRSLREAHRLELQPYGSVSLGDPYLQRWGAGLRSLFHVREGLALGLDATWTSTWATQELVIAKRELHARIVESRQRASLAAVASVAPLYGKVALPGDTLVQFETFLDAGFGGAYTETDLGRGLRPLLVGGVGQRIFLGESTALTARVGGNLYAERVSIDGAQQTRALGFWSLQLGLSFYFGGGGDR